MKLHNTNTSAHSNQLNIITGYGPQHLSVNKTLYTHPILLQPEDNPSHWVLPEKPSIQDIESALKNIAATYNIFKIIIIGCGAKQFFLSNTCVRSLEQSGIAVEPMLTQAACGVYNVLSSEGRDVLAALLLPSFFLSET